MFGWWLRDLLRCVISVEAFGSCDLFCIWVVVVVGVLVILVGFGVLCDLAGGLFVCFCLHVDCVCWWAWFCGL